MSAPKPARVSKRVREQLSVIAEIEKDLRDHYEGGLDPAMRNIMANSIQIALRVIRTDLRIRQKPETAEARALREEAEL